MIRVYLDWNVYSRIENSNVEPYPELRNILLNNNKFIFPYSTAHIIDIHESYLKVGWENVQGHISSLKLSNNLHLMQPFENDPGFYIENPSDALKAHIQNINPSITFDEIDETNNPNYIDYFPETTKFLKEQDEISEKRQKIISGFQEILNTFLGDGFKQNYQKGMNINKGKLLNKNTSVSEYLNENAVNGGYNNFEDFNSDILSKVNKNPNFISELSSLFIGIDISGYKEDTSKISSTITDSMHCAWASTCDIFIVDDIRTFYKSIEVYKMKKIMTKAFRPNGFIEYFNKTNLAFEDGMQLIDSLFDYCKSEEPTTILENGKTFFLNEYILDFFNLIVSDNENQYLRLHKLNANNQLVLLTCEKEDLLVKINSLFGEPKLIHDNWEENGTLNSAWIYNELELIKLSIDEGSVVLSFIKCKKIVPET